MPGKAAEAVSRFSVTFCHHNSDFQPGTSGSQGASRVAMKLPDCLFLSHQAPGRFVNPAGREDFNLHIGPIGMAAQVHGTHVDPRFANLDVHMSFTGRDRFIATTQNPSSSTYVTSQAQTTIDRFFPRNPRRRGQKAHPRCGSWGQQDICLCALCSIDCNESLSTAGRLLKMCLQTEALHIYPQVAETVLNPLILLPAGEIRVACKGSRSDWS